jgi:NADH dehydrogenase FAD-containing subunit
MMTGYPGIFAGGDMVPAERTVTVAIGHGKKAARNISAWLQGGMYTPAEKHEVASIRQPQHRGTTAMLRRPCARCWIIIRRKSTFDEVQGGLTRTMRCSRHGVACRAATASSATTAMAYARTTP